jgi:hypothetical protein
VSEPHEKQKRDYNYWSVDDVEVLEGFYSSVENERLSSLMGRSIPSIVTKAHRLGLRKSRLFISMISAANVGRRYENRLAS